MSICVIFNPVARGEKAARFRAHLGALTRECALRPTTGPGAASELARAAVEEGFETVVAAGGDGTVNEVLNGIGQAKGGFDQVRFGVLPLGTINVFAREIRMPARFDPAWSVIRSGRELRIDLGLAEFNQNNAPSHRYFVQMAGAGWDARAIALVDWEMKKRLGPLAYVVAGLKALRGPQAAVNASDGRTSVAGPLVLIGNGRFYGGNWRLFPLADLQDGQLEVSIFPRLDWLAVAQTCFGILCNRLYSAGGARHFRAAAVETTSTAPLPFHVEGENAGFLPARFSVRPRCLRVLVP